MRDGKEHLGKNVPQNPFCYDRFFIFIDEDFTKTAIPYDLIKQIDFYQDEESD